MAECLRCGLAWQHPLPAAAELAEAYRSLRDEKYISEERSRQRSAMRALTLLARYASPAEGRLLDVGCSTGIFLNLALHRGWDAHGVEPSAWMAGAAQARVGKRVQRGSFEGAAWPRRHFAVVTMWDVLEHVVDPAAFLSKARELLVPGGRLVLNVPRRDSAIARVAGTRWPLLLPEHVWYFTLASLRTLLERTGFRFVGHHLHVVEFSIDYVLERLAQHRWPAAARGRMLASRLGVGRRDVPLLLGEVTVVARRPR